MRWRRARRPVLDGLGVALPPGALVSVRGDNGAGKTTLLRAITGVLVPEHGSIRVDGIDVRAERRAARRRLSYLPAGAAGLYARLSVRAHLELWARVSLLEPAQRAPAVERALADFALGPVARSRADRTSTGQRQRVRLAMAFLADPRLVLLDEPSASLDPEGVELLVRAMRRVARHGGAVLWCAPSGDDGAVPADARFVLADGRLRAA